MDSATLILIPGPKLGPSRLAEQQDGEPKKRPQVSAALFASEHNQTISEEYQECKMWICASRKRTVTRLTNQSKSDISDHVSGHAEKFEV